MKTTLNKMKMIAITLVCVVFGVLFFINGSGEVKAETSVTLNTTDTETEYAYAVFSTTEELNYVQTVIGKSAPEVSGTEQYLFAGWYSNKACTDAVKKYDASITTYYAKYIPEEVLNVKAQISTIAGNNDENEETRNIRFVSSVDNLSYNKVGFKLECNEQTLYNNSKTVFKRIDSATEGDEYTYSPKVVDTDSEYFITAVYPDVADFNTGFYVRAYIKTLDGVVVYGPSRYVRVSDGLTGSESLINMPVKDINGVITGDSVNVTYNGNTVSANVLQPESKDADDTYAHILIDLNGVKKDALKSVTTFSVGGLEVKYRNLFTTHVNTASGTTPLYDTSWYEAYKDDSSIDSYVLATSADLYGLAQIVNGTAKDSSGAKMQSNFAGKKVYVISDVELNKGYANAEDINDLKWDTTKDVNGEQFKEGVEGTSYQWTRIGTSESNAFSGTFDGQMHSFSGVYYNDSTTNNWHGLFGFAVKATTIKKFSLTNSYFTVTANCMGSIVGRAQGGTYESLYSDAIVKGANVNIGGFIGQHQRDKTTLTMANCWFNGVVTNSNNYTGGFVGNELSGATFTNCLNTGTVQGALYVGGFVGDVDDKEVKFTYCLNSGTTTVTNADKTNVGAMAGSISDSDKKSDYGTVTFSNTFITGEALKAVYGKDNADGVTVITTDIAGINALTAKTQTLFSYIINEDTYTNESYWAITPNGAPVLASFAEYANAMPVDTSWYNTVDTEFVLSDASDLYGLALLSKTNNFEKKTLKLGADITINEGTPDEWTAETTLHNWLPIGYKDSSDANKDIRFAGTFDGQMHSINGMYLDATVSNVGMFATTNFYSTIKNLKLMNSSFKTTKGAIGSIVGYGYGTFDTIYSDAYVEGGSYWIGGFIGQTHSASEMTMNNCWFDGEVVHTGAGHATQKACVGGLLGLAHNTGTITNCLNTGSISSSATIEDPCVGGLVGRVSENKTLTIKHCFDAGSVSAEGATNTYGPVIGKVETSDKTTISTTFAYAENYVENASATYSGVTNVSKDTVHGTDALKKMKNLFTYTVSATEYQSYWAVVLNGAPVLESFAEEADKEFLAIDTSWYNGSGNYTLKDLSDLYGFTMLSSHIDFAGETVSLSKNIDSIVVNEGKPYGEDGKSGGGDDWEPKYEWISIGSTSRPFAGTFNGNMKSIEGLYLNGGQYSGMFSAVGVGSVIQNLSLKNSYFETSGNNVGSIVGGIYGGAIDTVFSDAIVIASGYNVGGLAGRVERNVTEPVTMNNCWFGGSVLNNTGSGQNTAGLIGNILSNTTVTNCLNTGAISMPNHETQPNVGGFAGNLDAEAEILFNRCFNSGIITCNEKVKDSGFGTFAGYAPSASHRFEECYTTIETVSVYAKGCNTAKYTNSKKFDKTNYYGTKAFDNASALFEAIEDENYRIYWGIVEGGTPVLSSFAEYVGEDAIAINTNWYDANKDSYTLTNAGDLYGFALISDKEAIAGYAGKTITLGQDITINEGTAADWVTVAPQFEWGSICTNANYRFQGTFEGNGKTISGLYLDETTTYRGFFGYTDNGSVVRNFRLVNSFFNSTAQAIGSVAGNARGSFDAIYSNAIVIGANANVGGMLGQISGNGVEITNCWFDGTVTNTSAEKQSTGGLIGAANFSVTMKNCLNTGSVSAPNYTKYDDGTTSIKPLIGGLIGYASPTQNITVLHSLNTGKVSFNSKATAGFGSVIGRIGNLGADQELGQIVVSNSYATSQSCWETVNTSHTGLDVSVTVVDENVIGGENAKEILSGLFDDNLTTSWVVGAECPVLKDFATYANTEKSISALHKWVSSSNTLTATLANPITLPNPDQANDTFFRQGGYTDGQYFYQAYIVEKDTENDEQGNKVKVLKYDLTNPDAPVVWSEEQLLRHANDVTFNSKLGYLVVCHGDKYISYFDITDDSLDYVNTVEVPYSISRIAYNEERDVYVTGTSTTLYVLNSDLQVSSSVFQLPAAPEGGARQSVSCDNDYLYYAITDGHTSGDKIEQIEVYDWSGQLVTTVTVTIDSQSDVIEFENISVVGDKLYIMAAEYSTVEGIQTEKPANVYIIDKSITE